jgi:hypothetical protein
MEVPIRSTTQKHDRLVELQRRRWCYEILHSEFPAVTHDMAQVIEAHQLRQQRRNGGRLAQKAGAGQCIQLEILTDRPPVTHALECCSAPAQGANDEVATYDISHPTGLCFALIQTIAFAGYAPDHVVASRPALAIGHCGVEWFLPEIGVPCD